MITDKIRALESLKQRAVVLEAAIVEERQRSLAELPRQYGFETADDFIDAVLMANGHGGTRKRGRPPSSGRSLVGRKRRRRAVITNAMRAEVKKLVQQGKTGAQIAATVGISLPSVQNVKKALGLVQARK